jgi:type I restriction enzyme M protein
MAIKKSQLYSTLWESCNNLRGGMDASQYKDYVLMVLFLKYLSDKDRAGADLLIDIPDGCHFEDIVALKDKSNIGEGINIILKQLGEANPDYAPIFLHAVDFCDEQKLGKGKDLVKTLTGLISCFQRDELDFGGNGAADDDLIGDAYEYLMKNFASQSGKSKGQFYTPAEVSILMSKLIGIDKEERPMVNVYDPTCGSCSLLLRARATASQGTNVSLNGQEYDVSTIRMAMMNMIIHGVDTPDLRQGDTLNNPLFLKDDKLVRFDYVVSNPPFSQKNWLKSAQRNDVYGRWSESVGVPPAKCGDYAFLLHVIASMNDKAKGAVILPHGVLFRGGSEADIRKHIVDQHYIKGIVGLPPNLFYGTGIPACIIILDKEGAAQRKGIYLIDAKEGYKKDGDKNRLRDEDIKLIADTWDEGNEVAHYAHFATFDEIAHNDYNLNIPRYVTPRDTEVHEDIYAHLHGGLPRQDIEAMSHIWQVCPSLKQSLFTPLSDNYAALRSDATDIAAVVKADGSFRAQQQRFNDLTEQWAQCRDTLLQLETGFQPKTLVEQLGQRVLDVFSHQSILVDPYDVYQQFRDYWTDTMQDDCYLIAKSGWQLELHGNGKKTVTYENLECDLLPVDIVIRVCFPDELKAITDKESEVEEEVSQMDQLKEDHPEAFTDDDDKALSEAAIKKLIKEQADDEFLPLWKEYLRHNDRKKTLNKELKTLKEALTVKVQEQYDALNANKQQLKHFVVDEKWLHTLREKFSEEQSNAVLSIINRVQTLHDRYADTLPELDKKEKELEQEVDDCLKEMGY